MSQEQVEVVRGHLEAFRSQDAPRTLSFLDPLTVDARILGGYPVIAGSRVPFDSVASLADEGADAAEIIEPYPSVQPRGIPDAQDFAEHVARIAA